MVSVAGRTVMTEDEFEDVSAAVSRGRRGTRARRDSVLASKAGASTGDISA